MADDARVGGRLDSIEQKLDRVLAMLSPVHSHAEWVDGLPRPAPRPRAREQHAADRGAKWLELCAQTSILPGSLAPHWHGPAISVQAPKKNFVC